MRARHALFLSAVLLVLGHPVARAGDEAVELEYVYFLGCTDEKGVDKWLEVKVKELDAAEGDPADPKVKAQLTELRAQLAKLAKGLGTEVRVHMVITEDTARIEAGTRVTLVRMDVDEPYIANFDTKEPNGEKIAVTVLEKDAGNQGAKTTFDGMSGKKKTVNGQSCIDYKLAGAIKAQVWLAEGDIKGFTIAQEFCIKAKDQMGGFRGEPLWAVTDEAQNFPIQVFCTGVTAGFGFDGKPRAAVKPYAMVLCKVTYHSTAPATELEIPPSKKVAGGSGR